uniref:Uncharacterized protein n=1 Tax=Salix viminalis TaxID=40686 RepID=A0A6N2L966_SALVM
MEYEAKPRVHKRVWLMFQKSMGILVGGNHTSSSERNMNLKALSCQSLVDHSQRILSGSDPGLLLDSMRYNGCDLPIMFWAQFDKESIFEANWGSIDCKDDGNRANEYAKIDSVRKLSVLVKDRLLRLCIARIGLSMLVGLRTFSLDMSLNMQKIPSILRPRQGFSPAIVVLEIERVLKPGGIGAILVGVIVSTPIA